MIETVLLLICLIPAIEGLLQILIRGLRRQCPWLIFKSDILPEINKSDIDKFVSRGWDQELG